MLVHISGIPSIGQKIEKLSSSKTSSLPDKLREIGDDFGCYFTLETALLSGDISNSLEGHRVTINRNVGTLSNALDQLRILVPNFAYKFDRFNSKIVYIYDNRLLRKKDYALESTLGEIRFNGTAIELVQVLAKRGIELTSYGPQSSTELGTENITAALHIRATRVKVRDLITNSLPLKNRGRLLWIARTELIGNQKTFVRFRR